MMTPLQKKRSVTISLLVLIGGAALIVAWMQLVNRTPDTQSPTPSDTQTPSRDETAFPTSPINFVVTPAASENTVYKTIENRYCGVLFTIPSDWVVNEYLGVTKLISPEDARENEAWVNTHPELVQMGDGDAPSGPDKRSLVISCQNDAEIHTADVSPVLVRTMSIDGWKASEIAQTYEQLDGTDLTFYSIIIELDRPQQKVVTIDLGDTEYNDLSTTVQQIIQGMSFEI